MSNDVFYVTVDKAAFLVAVQKYIDLSPLTNEWNVVKALKWPDALLPPALWTTIGDIEQMVALTVAAVELAKVDIIKEQDPDGSKGAKFDKEIALATAVQILLTLVQFKGWLGAIVNKIWPPILNLVVSIYVNQQPAGDWVAIALKVLAIATS
jgi:hypothetical protein